MLFRSFPEAFGESIYIQGNEIASANGSLAVTTPNSFVINANAQTSLKSWRFDESGGLMFPDATVQITAFTTSYITNEANARVAADATLQSNITAEVNARAQAISNEANARVAADTTLQNNINTEANTRATADISLQSNITALDASLATVAKSGSYPDLINRPNFTAFNSNLTPDTDNTRFLGNTTNRWHSLYVGPGSIYVGNIAVKESGSGSLLSNAPFDLSNSQIAWTNVTSKPNFANVATSGAYGDLSGVPTNLNQFTNGPDFANVTYVNTSVGNEATLRSQATANLQSQINNILNNADPAALDSLSEIVAAFQGADGNLLSALSNISSTSGSNLTAETNRAVAAEANLQSNITSLSNSLSTVAFSGSYSDLTNKPANVSVFTNDSAYITASSTDTLTNKTINIKFGQNNVFKIQDNSILSYTGSGGVVVLDTSPTLNSFNIGNGSGLTIDGGTGSSYWAGQSSVAQAGDNKAGVYRTTSSASNGLFTFGAGGSGTMSVGVEGSLFVGTSMPTNNGGLNTNYSGWLVVQSGGKFGGDVNTLGALKFDHSTNGYIQFYDGTIQRTAWDTGYLSFTKASLKGTSGYQYTFNTDGYFTSSANSESTGYFFVTYNSTNLNIGAGWTVVGAQCNTTVSSTTYPVAGYPGVIKVNLTAAASGTTGFYPVRSEEHTSELQSH